MQIIVLESLEEVNDVWEGFIDAVNDNIGLKIEVKNLMYFEELI